MVCLEHKELHKHRQHSWAFEGISGGCGAFPHQHPSCSTQLNLKKQLSPQAKLYPRRSSIISLRITELRQDLLSEVGEKSYWGRCQETAPSIISAPQKKNHYRASQAVAEHSHGAGILHPGLTEMLGVIEELL